MELGTLSFFPSWKTTVHYSFQAVGIIAEVLDCSVDVHHPYLVGSGMLYFGCLE